MQDNIYAVKFSVFTASCLELLLYSTCYVCTTHITTNVLRKVLNSGCTFFLFLRLMFLVLFFWIIFIAVKNVADDVSYKQIMHMKRSTWLRLLNSIKYLLFLISDYKRNSKLIDYGYCNAKCCLRMVLGVRECVYDQWSILKIRSHVRKFEI